jgi:ABC-type lipoprotein export system ATPase subunit
VIELRSVDKIYPTAAGPVPALHGIDLTIQRGEFVAVVGPTGSGKSTLLNLISCLDVATSGQVLFLDSDTATLSDDELSRLRNRSVGFVFQTRNLVVEMTVRANVELPLIYAGVTRDRHVRSDQLLGRLGIADRAEQLAGTLSAGDQQLVAVARALVTDPDLIVADEPTGAIDRGDSAEQFLAILRDLHAKGRTLVLATDNEQVAAAAERVVRLTAGTIAAKPNPPRPAVKLGHPAATHAELGA